jgi:hypothetical protein
MVDNSQQNNLSYSDQTPLPSDFAIPYAALHSGQTFNTLGDYFKWKDTLPKIATRGPSQENPYIAPDQDNNSINNALNQRLGAYTPAQTNVWSGLFAPSAPSNGGN